MFNDWKALGKASLTKARLLALDIYKKSAEAYEKYHEDPEPLEEIAAAVGDLHDAVMRQKRGTAVEIAAQVAAKVGTTAAFSGALLGAAAMFGTASTGTAIGTLSGAAFTSAALAWIGGSVAVGTAIVGVGAVAVGIPAVVTTRRLIRKHISAPPREEKDLTPNEARHLDSLKHLLITLKRLEQEQPSQPRLIQQLMWSEILEPSIVFFDDRLYAEYSDWPVYSRHRLDRAIAKLKQIRGRESRLNQISVPLGIVAAVALKLLGGSTNFSEQEELVLDAFRRSTSNLESATTDEIAEYLDQFTPAQLVGIQNNVKGIYHEIAYVTAENTDDDQYFARLFPDTNHAGGDVEILDANTGEVLDVIQLKATDSAAQVANHLERYQEIGIQVTKELSEKMGADESGFSNEELSNELRETMDKLSGDKDFQEVLGVTLATGVTASLVTFLISAGAALRHGDDFETLKSDSLGRATKALKLGGIAALVSELIA